MTRAQISFHRVTKAWGPFDRTSRPPRPRRQRSAHDGRRRRRQPAHLRRCHPHTTRRPHRPQRTIQRCGHPGRRTAGRRRRRPGFAVWDLDPPAGSKAHANSPDATSPAPNGTNTSATSPPPTNLHRSPRRHIDLATSHDNAANSEIIAAAMKCRSASPRLTSMVSFGGVVRGGLDGASRSGCKPRTHRLSASWGCGFELRRR